MSFVSLPVNWKPDYNFWEQNGQLSIIYPFSKIYNLDNGGDESSKMMTTIFLMADPDEDKNKFARMSEDMRRKEISENYYPDIDWENPLLKEGIEKYPELCLSAIARTLKTVKESLARRAEFLRTVIYTEDNIAKIDTAISKNLKIYEDFEAIEQKFITQEKTGKIRGGRKQSYREKGLL